MHQERLRPPTLRRLFGLVVAGCAWLAQPVLADTPMTIHFAAELGGKPFACGEDFTGLGTGGDTVTPADFRFFITDVALIGTDGKARPAPIVDDGPWQSDGIALLDFEDGRGACTSGNPEMNTDIRIAAPAGDWTGLSFTVGLPFAIDHADPTVAPSPLNVTGMFWSWQAGYAFLRIDLKPEVAGQPRGDAWFLHLGSTMCAGPSPTEAPDGPCVHPNLVHVRLDGFHPGESTVVADPAGLLAGVDLGHPPAEGRPGCMSLPGNATCGAVIPALGLAYGGAEAQPQALFRLR